MASVVVNSPRMSKSVISQIATRIKAEMKDISSDAHDSILKGFNRSCKALSLGDDNAGAVTQDSHTDVLAFTVGLTTSNTKASPLFVSIPVAEVKASSHRISAMSSVRHDVWKCYCQTGAFLQ